MGKETKPSDFQEIQKAAKEILKAENVNYFEWLHKMHMDVVFKVISKNPEKVGLLVNEKSARNGVEY